MYDARAIANGILDSANERGIACSNLKLQKLLYFSHGRWLTKYGEPLCIGSFEAWTHGPVHPLVYRAFQDFGANTIVGRAEAFDPLTRRSRPLAALDGRDVVDTIHSVVLSLGHLTGSQLRNITHRKGGPWDVIMKAAESSANVGLKIPDAVIREHFGKQLYIIGAGREEKDLHENSPYSSD